MVHEHLVGRRDLIVDTQIRNMDDLVMLLLVPILDIQDLEDNNIIAQDNKVPLGGPQARVVHQLTPTQLVKFHRVDLLDHQIKEQDIPHQVEWIHQLDPLFRQPLLFPCRQ